MVLGDASGGIDVGGGTDAGAIGGATRAEAASSASQSLARDSRGPVAHPAASKTNRAARA